MDRKRFTACENTAQILSTRCCSFIAGLVVISRNSALPRALVDDLCLLINEFQEIQNVYQGLSDSSRGGDTQYTCPSEQLTAYFTHDGR